METMFIPLYYKPFGLYFMKKLFQNYEWLKHNEQSIVAIDLVHAPCTQTLKKSFAGKTAMDFEKSDLFNKIF